MRHWLASMAEEKIQEAMRDGKFNDLPGAGKPLPPDDAAHVPEELRVAFKMLKNAGMIPEEMQIRKDILTLEDLLSCCADESERAKLRGEISARKLRYQSLMADRGWQGSNTFTEYEHKIQDKLTEK